MDAPPKELMEKLVRLQQEFPQGFVICVAPSKEKGSWFGVFRWNPRGLKIVNALYEHIIGNQIHSGTQN